MAVYCLLNIPLREIRVGSMLIIILRNVFLAASQSSKSM